jgi:hypothetical protein
VYRNPWPERDQVDGDATRFPTAVLCPEGAPTFPLVSQRQGKTTSSRERWKKSQHPQLFAKKVIPPVSRAAGRSFIGDTQTYCESRGITLVYRYTHCAPVSVADCVIHQSVKIQT